MCNWYIYNLSYKFTSVLASASHSIQIALIDSNPLSIPSLSGSISNRVVSLTPASQSFLERIDAWKHLDLNRVFPYKNITVWDGLSDGVLKFHSDSMNKGSHLASMIELQNLQQALLKRANELSHRITVLDASKVDFIQRDPISEWPIVHLKDSSVQVECQLLVGADGGQSKVREFANITSLGWDYKQKGIVATLALQDNSSATFIDTMENSTQDNSIKNSSQENKMENTTAWQRFLPSGTIALLPLGPGKSSLVWSVSESLSPHLLKLNPQNFISMVNAALHNPWTDIKYLFSEIQNSSSDIDLESESLWSRGKVLNPVDAPLVSGLASPLASFPLRFRQSPYFGSFRLALIGDAAHTIHPLAGQGLNMGLSDADQLSKCVLKAYSRGQDLGDYLVLQDYTKKAMSDNLKMGLAIHSLHNLFWNESELLAKMRSFGLNSLDKLDPVKQFFIGYASGL